MKGPSTTLDASCRVLPRPLYEQLVPRRNASSSAVAAHQRARLHAAMVEACADHGYPATTARELVTLAGVSTKALYMHFGSKEECFLATYDLVVQQAVGRISAAYRAAPDGKRDWAAGLCRAFEAFSVELVERPGPSRLALVDVLAAGPGTLLRIERVEASFASMIRKSLAQGPDGRAVSPALIRPLIGGIWFVSRSRLLEGRPETLATCGAELLEWILSYRTAAAVPLVDVPHDPARLDLRGRRPVFEGLDERTRLLRATAVLIARDGHGALSPGRITELAGLGSEVFPAHFADVQQCFLATLELLSAQALARALRESEAATSWAEGVFWAVRALFRQVAEDRAFARAAFISSFAAGPAGVDRRTALMQSFADILARRAPAGRRPDPLVAEAIVGSIWSMAHRQVARDQAHRLPALSARAAFLALAPIVGAEEAQQPFSALAST